MGKYEKLEKRLDKIEKHLGLNTEVTVSKMESVEELPEKWFVRATEENINVLRDWYGHQVGSTNYIFGMAEDYRKDITKGYNPPEQTKGGDYDFGEEITFDQFKKWVLKEYDSNEIPKITEVQVDCSELTKEQIQELSDIVVDNGFTIWEYQKPLNTYIKKWHIFFRKRTELDVSGDDIDFGIFTYANKKLKNITYQQFKEFYSKEKPDLGNADTSLSIREVQVKVSSQEEANECAEITKACGENIGNITVSENFNIFRFDNYIGGFFVSSIGNKKNTEISIQEYRERFGKENKFEIPKYITQEEAFEFGRRLETSEIDWRKYGEYVESDWEIVMVMKNKSKIEDDFTGVIIKMKEGCDFEKGLYSKTWNKKAFKLCTEPITLSNERN